VASFILLQLVIAVLMEQLANSSDSSDAHWNRKTPGCINLRLAVFARMYRRWRFKALQKLKRPPRERRRKANSEADGEEEGTTETQTVFIARHSA
jgi:hypothetical protein